MNPSNKRKASSLPNETVEYLKAWMMSPEHIAHPYPTEVEKAKIMQDTGIEMKQLTNWFVNNRKRFWKPRVEARLREQQLHGSSVPPITKRDGSLLSLVDLASNKLVSPRSTPKRRASMAPIISEQSSVVSSNESLSDDDEEDPETLTRDQDSHTETFNLHILRPARGHPQLRDVTLDDDTDPSRVLKTFYNCALSYHDGQSREAEINRIKSHYLDIYLQEEARSQRTTTTTKKRVYVEEIPMTPRAKYQRVGLDLWKTACLLAEHTYDCELPSMDEAAQLFGYA